MAQWVKELAIQTWQLEFNTRNLPKIQMQCWAPVIPGETGRLRQEDRLEAHGPAMEHAAALLHRRNKSSASANWKQRTDNHDYFTYSFETAILPCSPRWSRTQYVDLAGFELTEIHPPLSPSLLPVLSARIKGMQHHTCLWFSWNH